MPETMAEKIKTTGISGRVPPGVGLDGAEDEADVSVQQEGGGDADESDDPADSVVDVQGARADVVGAQRHHRIDAGACRPLLDRDSRTMSRR